jgi:hypothetical protein
MGMAMGTHNGQVAHTMGKGQWAHTMGNDVGSPIMAQRAAIYVYRIFSAKRHHGGFPTGAPWVADTQAWRGDRPSHNP